VVTTKASTKTATPHPARVHQPAWLAAARSVWPETAIFEVTRAPTTATPSVWPICRDVEAMPAATPAWARGMPDTAALVMGAFTKPKPMPKIT